MPVAYALLSVVAAASSLGMMRGLGSSPFNQLEGVAMLPNEKVISARVSSSNTCATINRAALDALQAILARWFSDDGQNLQHKRIAWNMQADRNAGSFSIDLITGRWTNFVTGDRGSDIIGLASHLLNIDQIEAACRLAAMLGMGDCHE
jgi:hypothetical protein